ncbi:MAG: hypothetical protein EA393_11850 [Bacteroidetes bacterium]|nr:MAG: hypothetical protein EA393_11850 [Bacteroidota bacterium]
MILITSSGIRAFAQAPKYSNEFLSIGVGARAMGMSNAFVSVADDATAGYWNPAGLLQLDSDAQIALMHTEYFAGIASYDYGSIAFKTDENSALGFSYIRFGVDDIPNTTELIDSEGNINYDRIRSFSASDNAFILSYARRLNENFNLGVNAKVIRRTAGSFAGAWGFGLDAGIQYIRGDWRFAAMGRDITSTFNAWAYNLDDEMREVFTLTGNEIPENSIEVTLPRVILGASRNFVLGRGFGLLASADLIVTTDGKRNVLFKSNLLSADPAMGVELNFNQMIFLRAGAGNYQKYSLPSEKTARSVQMNVGLGVVIRDILTIDYALTDFGDNSIALYSNIFSLKLNINRRDRPEY